MYSNGGLAETTSRLSLRMMSDSSCLVISSAAPRPHDQGVWQLCRVMRLPVPMLIGEKLMGVFSPLVLHQSGFIRVGTGYRGDPKTNQH